MSPSDGQNASFAGTANEAALKALVARYLKLLFGFCLSYAAYSREQAFQLTVSSFVHALRARSGDEREFAQALFKQALAECSRTVPAGESGLASFGAFSTPPQPFLAIVREALMRVTPSDRAVLLLRDQCHLSFEHVGAVLGLSARETRLLCLSARENLRSAVEDILKKPKGPAHAV